MNVHGCPRDTGEGIPGIPVTDPVCNLRGEQGTKLLAYRVFSLGLRQDTVLQANRVPTAFRDRPQQHS